MNREYWNQNNDSIDSSSNAYKGNLSKSLDNCCSYFLADRPLWCFNSPFSLLGMKSRKFSRTKHKKCFSLLIS